MKQTFAPGRALLTKKELAESLNLSTRTIERWTKSKKIPCLRINHQILRYKLEDVLRSLEKFKVEGIS